MYVINRGTGGIGKIQKLISVFFLLVSLRFATRSMKTTHGGLGTNVAEAF